MLIAKPWIGKMWITLDKISPSLFFLIDSLRDATVTTVLISAYVFYMCILYFYI